MIRFGSLFTGIGGFDLAFAGAGMSCAWMVERDKACQAVLARRFPGVPIFSDVATVGRLNLEPVDLVCGGFPCQDLSIAGARAGLRGERSGLWWEFHRILDELRPDWCVIENVPGLLSSDGGRDMGAILRALGRLGYGYAYRVLDAQRFGLAQRRERVFVVGHLGDAARAVEVLLEPEGVSGDLATRGSAGEDIAGTLGGGSGARGWCNDLDRSGAFVAYDERQVTSPGNRSNPQPGSPCHTPHGEGPLLAGTLAPGAHPGGFNGRDAESGMLVSHALSTREWQRQDPNGETYITHALTAEGHDASEDGTGRGTPLVAAQLTHGGHPGSNAPGRRREDDINLVADPICANEARTYSNAGNNPRPRNVVAVYQCHGSNVGPMGSLRRGNGNVTGGVPFIGVRRLTPTECSRLQGFPDDWLEGESDAAKYRQLGNAVAVNVARWIGRRIVAAEERSA